MRYAIKIEILDEDGDVVATVNNEEVSDLPHIEISSIFTSQQWEAVSSKVTSALSYIVNNG